MYWAGGDWWIVNSGRVDVAMGGMSAGISRPRWVHSVVALSCLEFLVAAWKTKMISGVIELMDSLGWNRMILGYSIRRTFNIVLSLPFRSTSGEDGLSRRIMVRWGINNGMVA